MENSDDKRVALRVLGITYSQVQSGAYALVLTQVDGTKRLPIIIGTSEAQSIAIEIENLVPPRPLTHDLFVSVLKAFNIKLKEVYIYRFEEGVFSSNLILEGNDGVEKIVDSRTSDAISIALRSQAPIFVSETVLNKAGVEFDEELESIDHDASNTEHATALYSALDDAVKREDYEEASRLRDLIKQEKTKEEGPTQTDDKL